LPSFGEKLKQEREKRKMTLEQISASTKIGTRLLQALEEDKFNQLPGGIFNKGFVRAYSHCLGLDEDQTVAEYLEASGDAPPPPTEIPIRPDEARENEEHVRRLEASGDGSFHRIPWGWFAALLLVIAIALSLWNRRQREHARHLNSPTPTATAVQPPVSDGSGGQSGTTTGATSGTVSGTAADLSNPTAPTANAGNPGRGGESAASGTTPASSGASGSAAPNSSAMVSAMGSTSGSAAAAGEFTVVIRAREESWVAITADGRDIPSELLLAGSERTARGQKEIVVKIGNAAGVDFRFNGKKLDTGGQHGEVRTVVFGPRGMSANAPAAASVP
jgi:cytoskeleton protein RodZ